MVKLPLDKLRTLPSKSIEDYLSTLFQELDNTIDEQHKERLKNDIQVALLVLQTKREKTPDA